MNPEQSQMTINRKLAKIAEYFDDLARALKRANRAEEAEESTHLARGTRGHLLNLRLPDDARWPPGLSRGEFIPVKKRAPK